MKISYDYNELIQEIQLDRLEGLIKDELFIVRTDKSLSDGYKPIIDYYYLDYVKNKGADNDDKFKLIKKKVVDVIKEMEERNSLI